MKKAKKSNSPAWRFVASTLVGQVFDTLIFASIAFWGIISANLWLNLVISNYVYKVGLEIILLPLTLLIVRKVKKDEKIDISDEGISLNPFVWDLSKKSKGDKPNG
jgi:uncharacterized integral membrane protein (TIGR00697 family)